MKKWVVYTIIGLVILVLYLAFAVLQDANAEPIGACQDLDGSVCSPNTNCPDGFSLAPRYACENENFLCCQPG